MKLFKKIREKKNKKDEEIQRLKIENRILNQSLQDSRNLCKELYKKIEHKPKKKVTKKKKSKNYVGEKIGDFVIIERIKRVSPSNSYIYKAKCSVCGAIKTQTLYDLKRFCKHSNHHKSCCYKHMNKQNDFSKVLKSNKPINDLCSTYKNHIGEKIGDFTIIDKIKIYYKSGSATGYVAQCNVCGAIKKGTINDIKKSCKHSTNYKSCCFKHMNNQNKLKISDINKVNHEGERIGDFYIEKNLKNNYYQAKCLKCGATRITTYQNLKHSPYHNDTFHKSACYKHLQEIKESQKSKIIEN